MNATVFGAGNIGRGLVGDVLDTSGYRLTFIEANRDLVDRLAAAGSYTIDADGATRAIPIGAIIDAADHEAVVAAVAGADVVATAVGPAILKVVARAVGEGLAVSTRPEVNVLACENVHPNSTLLAGHVRDLVGQEAADRAGFPDVVVDRIVPGSPGALDLMVEADFEFVVDGSGWRGSRPDPTPIVFATDFAAYKLRKLWLVNGVHAAIAWLGIPRGHRSIHLALADPAIRPIVESFSRTAAAALAATTNEFDEAGLAGYVAGVLRRFENERLQDPTVRVARNPLLKLSKGERILGPAIAAERAGLDMSPFAAAIAAGLSLQDRSVEGVEELQRRVAETGWRAFLIADGEVGPTGPLMTEISQHLSDSQTEGETMVSEKFVIENPAGLHARPAAEIVEQAKALNATVQIRKGDKTANASSIMSLLALGASVGDTVTVVAEGEDAASAVAALRTIMQAKEG